MTEKKARKEPKKIFRLSAADQEIFAKALVAPPRPNPALKRAFLRASGSLISDAAAFSRKIGLTNEGFEIFNRVSDKTPAEPHRFG